MCIKLRASGRQHHESDGPKALIPLAVRKSCRSQFALRGRLVGGILAVYMRADYHLRPIRDGDRAEVAELIYNSINTWYERHGKPQIFRGGSGVCEVFYDVYNDLTPGCSVVAEQTGTGRLMGSCFYHPREHHVSLGIMTVHPDFFGAGVGSALVRHIIDYTAQRGSEALRLTQSAINVDSFSLYNKAGFVPRYSYQDMMVEVPEEGLRAAVPGTGRVRPATLADVAAMAALEFEVSGITREPDCRYCIENARGFWGASVIDAEGGEGIDGWLLSSGHSAMNLIGPGVARDETAMLALVFDHLNRYPGRAPVVLIPMDKQLLVRSLFGWGARIVEMHFCQVRGRFQPFEGVNIPTFLPETG